jgi:putative membrane protein
MKSIFAAIGSALALGIALNFMLTAEATVKADFWTEAAQGGMAEVALSNIALERSQNEAVKNFAQQMVTDHTAANTELISLASSKNITLPSAIDAKHKAASDRLAARSGADFDRDYMKMTVKDHEKMVKLFQNESEKGADADVKAWAAKTLPTLQSHLQMARTVNASLGGMSGEKSMNSGSDHDMNMNSNKNRNSNKGTSGNSNSSRRTNSNSNSNANR